MKFSFKKLLFLYYFCFFMMIILTVSSCAIENSRGPEPNVSAAKKERIVGELVAKRDFLGLFQQAEKIGNKNEHGVYIIHNAVLTYIKSCCEDREGAVSLLKDNGFQVWEGGRYNPKKSSKVKLPQYEEEICGEKRASNFLYTWKSYKICLYVADRKVAGVFAYAYSDSL